MDLLGQSHILLIINPIAGTRDKMAIIHSLTKRAGDLGMSYSIYRTTGNNDREHLITEISRHKPDRVIVVGGDGSISLVSNIIKGLNIPMGIIPAGSANGLAYNFNLPQRLDEQISVALGNNFYTMDLLNVNGNTCLHIADLGVNAELISNFKESNIRGTLGYVLNAIPTLIATDSPYTFRIDINGQSIIESGILLAIANARSYGLGGTINPLGKMNDGKFEVLIFKSFDAIEIIKTLYDKADLESGFAECFSANRAVIQTRRPIPFQIDGEYMEETSKVEVHLDADTLAIAVPK